jgi:hypothetical protein
MPKKPLILNAFTLEVAVVLFFQPVLFTSAATSGRTMQNVQHSSGILPQSLVSNDGWSADFLTGLNGSVFALGFYTSDVYVGGDFTQAGVTTLNHIASWNGTSWAGFSSVTDDEVDALAVGGKLSSMLGQWNEYRVYVPSAVK